MEHIKKALQCKADENMDVRKQKKMVSPILGLNGPILFPTEDRAEENTDPRGVTL
jgi:hypothetical protein